MNDIELSIEARERVAAAHAAAEILRGAVDVEVKEISSVDLISVAFWIHTGLDPHDTRLHQRNPFPDAAEWTSDLVGPGSGGHIPSAPSGESGVSASPDGSR